MTERGRSRIQLRVGGSVSKASRGVNDNRPRLGSTGPSRYMVPGVKGDVGEKGVARQGAGGDRGAWGNLEGHSRGCQYE